MKKAVNMKRNMRGMLIVFVIMFVSLGSYLMYSNITYGRQWFSTPYNPRISAANNISDAGTIFDRNGIPLAYSVGDERQYADDSDMRKAVSHIVGDVYGKSLGAETYFAKYLYGYDQGLLDKVASISSGSKGADIYLTIDAELCEYIYNHMDYNGAAVVMNYRTGEILASVSAPAFDPQNLGNISEEEEEGAIYLNRALQGRYPPGSTMKIVTAAAALNYGITDLELICTGEDYIDGQRITCPKEGGHGDVDFKTAFEKSCNVYFGRLSELIGDAALLETAEDFEFNNEFSFPDFNMLKSNFELSGEAGDLAWAGIGQYKDLVTPLHNVLIASAVANGGTMMQPNTLLDVRYGERSAYNYTPSRYENVLEFSEAQQLADLMRSTVDHGTATSADIAGITIDGKTGTAEYYQNGEIKNHSWFIGFSEDTAHPYAVAVILEGAGYGSAHATPLAGQIFEKLLSLGY